MISVIVCYSNKDRIDYHQTHIHKTIGTEYEFIPIDNTNLNYNICQAYSKAVDTAKGEFIVFVHDDVFFISNQWGACVQHAFNQDQSIGLLGVAGTQYLFAELPLWSLAGTPFVKGQVVHQSKEDLHPFLTKFSQDPGFAEEVVVVDGLFFAIRSELFKNVHFDAITFDTFHFYDLDICMQVRKTHKIFVVYTILVKHLSRGHFNEQWRAYGYKFSQKYHHELPAQCCNDVPVIKKENLLFPEVIFYPHEHP